MGSVLIKQGSADANSHFSRESTNLSSLQPKMSDFPTSPYYCVTEQDGPPRMGRLPRIRGIRASADLRAYVPFVQERDELNRIITRGSLDVYSREIDPFITATAQPSAKKGLLSK